MYEEYFGLKDTPFQLTPDPKFFFRSGGHDRALAYLLFGLNQGEGFIVVTGEVGAGKTTLARYLLSTLDKRKYVAGSIVTTNLSGDDVIRMIAATLGLKYESRDKASLLRDFETRLVDLARRGLKAIIFIDEAQNLTFEALEELRMLTNIQVESVCPLQLFLLGQPDFRMKLAEPSLSQLRQRVLAGYHLNAMGPEETADYIIHRLKVVGWAGDPSFTDQALRRIHDFTDGVPRRINTLATRILMYCYLEQVHNIDDEVVEAVADELQNEFAFGTASLGSV